MQIYLSFYSLGFTCLCLYVMLFWRKKRINLLIFCHTILVMSLLTGAWNVSDFHDVHNITDRHEIDIINYYDFMDFLHYTIPPFAFIWLYEWWHIGKAREKYDQNTW